MPGVRCVMASSTQRRRHNLIHFSFQARLPFVHFQRPPIGVIAKKSNRHCLAMVSMQSWLAMTGQTRLKENVMHMCPLKYHDQSDCGYLSKNYLFIWQ
jgi:hypothetical protein